MGIHFESHRLITLDPFTFVRQDARLFEMVPGSIDPPPTFASVCLVQLGVRRYYALPSVAVSPPALCLWYPTACSPLLSSSSHTTPPPTHYHPTPPPRATMPPALLTPLPPDPPPLHRVTG